MAKAFIKNCWYAAAWSSEIVNEIHATTIICEPLIVYRQPDGGVVVMEDRCCHRFAPLSKGRLEDGRNVRCMYHGMVFNSDGACIEIPCQDKIPASAKIRTYPAVERGGWVWVWMGEADKADPDLVPPVVDLDDPDFILKTASLEYEADYQFFRGCWSTT